VGDDRQRVCRLPRDAEERLAFLRTRVRLGDVLEVDDPLLDGLRRRDEFGERLDLLLDVVGDVAPDLRAALRLRDPDVAAEATG